LKLLVERNFNVKVIICGGDGTVMWVISELNKYNIDTELTPLAIIPLGTGNDFSQYLGWGKLKTTLT
jgi:diacylglycerol kinase (ATP)